MGRDRYVLNPGATSATQLEMFVFLGKLMGHAMRWVYRGGRLVDVRQGLHAATSRGFRVIDP